MEFDPCALVDEVVREHALIANRKGLTLHSHVGMEVPPTVSGDPTP